MAVIPSPIDGDNRPMVHDNETWIIEAGDAQLLSGEPRSALDALVRSTGWFTAFGWRITACATLAILKPRRICTSCFKMRVRVWPMNWLCLGRSLHLHFRGLILRRNISTSSTPFAPKSAQPPPAPNPAARAGRPLWRRVDAKPLQGFACRPHSGFDRQSFAVIFNRELGVTPDFGGFRAREIRREMLGVNRFCAGELSERIVFVLQRNEDVGAADIAVDALGIERNGLVEVGPCRIRVLGGEVARAAFEIIGFNIGIERDNGRPVVSRLGVLLEERIGAGAAVKRAEVFGVEFGRGVKVRSALRPHRLR